MIKIFIDFFIYKKIKQEKFCMIKDEILFSHQYDRITDVCLSCKENDHHLKRCPLITYQPIKSFLILKHNYSKPQKRQSFARKHRNYNALEEKKHTFKSALALRFDKDIMHSYKISINSPLDEIITETNISSKYSIDDIRQSYYDDNKQLRRSLSFTPSKGYRKSHYDNLKRSKTVNTSSFESISLMYIPLGDGRKPSTSATAKNIYDLKEFREARRSLSGENFFGMQSGQNSQEKNNEWRKCESIKKECQLSTFETKPQESIKKEFQYELKPFESIKKESQFSSLELKPCESIKKEYQFNPMSSFEGENLASPGILKVKQCKEKKRLSDVQFKFDLTSPALKNEEKNRSDERSKNDFMRIENRTSIDKLERQKTEKALTPTRKKLYTNKFISIKTIRTEDEGNSDYEKRNKIKEKEDKHLFWNEFERMKVFKNYFKHNNVGNVVHSHTRSPKKKSKATTIRTKSPKITTLVTKRAKTTPLKSCHTNLSPNNLSSKGESEGKNKGFMNKI